MANETGVVIGMIYKLVLRPTEGFFEIDDFAPRTEHGNPSRLLNAVPTREDANQETARHQRERRSDSLGEARDSHLVAPPRLAALLVMEVATEARAPIDQP